MRPSVQAQLKVSRLYSLKASAGRPQHLKPTLRDHTLKEVLAVPMTPTSRLARERMGKGAHRQNTRTRICEGVCNL